MKPATLACAIYTRKSSEEGLEQGFNSLDAQREACEAYILSQKAMGWRCIPDAYDDGGFSGGNVERPGLKRLLADIAARRVQVVVVYKVDRLTRSLADFAKMVELFDTHEVSFVSITQQFNTTTSMGRLTLNVLLSFAQFEREVTGERIRDKIAASKRKGMWMGGIPPVGYAAKERSLVIVEDQAQTIREIYQLYLQLDCVRQTKLELDRRCWRTPKRISQREGQAGDRPFSRGHLYRILSNPVYIGKIAHGKDVYEGQHAPIIDQDLWNDVQQRLEDNRQGEKTRAHAANPSLLAGLVFDSQGIAYTPSHSKKGQRRYRYYIMQREPLEPHIRIPANELENAVMEAVVRWLTDEVAMITAIQEIEHQQDPKDQQTAKSIRTILRLASELAANIPTAPMKHLRGCVHKVVIADDRLQIIMQGRVVGAEEGDDVFPQFEVPATLTKCGSAVRLVIKPTGAPVRRDRDTTLVALIAKAYEWYSRFTSGQGDLQSLALQAGVTSKYVARVMQFALLAPDIVQRIARNEHSPTLNAERLIRMVPFPEDWQEQRRLLGFS